MKAGRRPRRPSTHRRRLGRASGPLLAVVLGAVAAACGAATITPNSTEAPLPSTTAAAGTAGAAPTHWPTLVIDGTIALAAADTDFKTMSTDIANAVNSQDPKQILDVMTNAVAFLQGNKSKITPLQGYPYTKQVGDQLAAAYDQMITGGQKVITSLGAGDGPGVQAGFTAFFSGSAAYANALPGLGDLSSQAILMQRNLLQ